MLFRYAVLPVTRISTLQKRAHVLGRLYVGGQPKRNVNRVCSWDTAFRRDDTITRFIPAVIKPLLVGCFANCINTAKQSCYNCIPCCGALLSPMPVDVRSRQ